MKILKNTFVFSLTLLIIFLGCKQKTYTQKVILAEGMQPICSPVYVADQKGFFKEQGLDVQLVPFSKGKLCLDAVLGGKANLATVAETPLMHLGFQKQPAVILCTMHYATKNTKCVARKDKGIIEPGDMKGHKIGVPIGGNAEYFMDKFLEKYDLSREDVKVVNLNPPEMVGAIVRGDIDASFSWEPHISRTVNQLGDKANVFFGEDLYKETFDLVCMKDWADANKITCEKVLKALLKATDFIHENKDESVEIVANHIQMDKKELASIWHYYTFDIVLDQFLMESLIDQAKWAIAGEIHEGDVPDYGYMFYVEPLKNIDASAINIQY
jgi:NitT/TauT family transport system substrate-binding protein